MPLPQMKRGSGTVSGIYRIGAYTAMLIRDAESLGSIKYFFMLPVTAQGETSPAIVVTLEHNEMQGELLRVAAQNMDEETRKALLADAPNSYLCMFDKNGGHHMLEQLSQVVPEEQFRERAFAVVARQLGVADAPVKVEREGPPTAAPRADKPKRSMGFLSALNPFTFSRKYYAAWNALMAAYTFEQLSDERKQQVLDKVEEIESSMRRRPVTLLEITAKMSEAAKYHLFSLAMMNLEIRPVLGTELWYEVKNPHVDLLNAGDVLASTKHKLEKQYRVEFPDLES